MSDKIKPQHVARKAAVCYKPSIVPCSTQEVLITRKRSICRPSIHEMRRNDSISNRSAL
jgi:hypothetical protein